MTTKEWTTHYPTAQDDVLTDQPTLINDTYPGAGDGDITRVSQIHALRDKLDSVCLKVGDDTNLPATSLLGRLYATSHTVWVDGSRSGVYTADGSFSRPYKTIMAAVNAVSPPAGEPYTIRVMAGSYSEQVTLKPDIVLVGDSINQTIISVDAAYAVRMNVSSSGVLRPVIKNFGIWNDSGYGIHITGDPGARLDGFQLDVWSGGAQAVYVDNGGIRIVECILSSDVHHGLHINGTGNSAWVMSTSIGTADPTGHSDIQIDAGAILDHGTLSINNNKITGTGTRNIYTFADLVKNDSTVSGTTVKDALNTLAAGSFSVPRTQQIWVDVARTDSYTPDGTYAKPYKTIATALASITDATPSKRYTMILSAGLYYEVGLIPKECVTIIGMGPAATVITGTTAAVINANVVNSGTGDPPTFENLAIYSQTYPCISVTNGCHVWCNNVITFGDAANCFSVSGASSELVLKQVDTWAINGHGIYVGSGGIVTTRDVYARGQGTSKYDIQIDAGGFWNSDGSFWSGANGINVAGTRTYINKASYIGNDSSVSGTTVKDALNTLLSGGAGFAAREQEFTAVGGDENFTLSATPAVNANTLSGRNILGVWRNGQKLRYQASPTIGLEFGYTAPTTIVCKSLTAGDIINVVYGS